MELTSVWATEFRGSYLSAILLLFSFLFVGCKGEESNGTIKKPTREKVPIEGNYLVTIDGPGGCGFGAWEPYASSVTGVLFDHGNIIVFYLEGNPYDYFFRQSERRLSDKIIYLPECDVLVIECPTQPKADSIEKFIERSSVYSSVWDGADIRTTYSGPTTDTPIECQGRRNYHLERVGDLGDAFPK